MTADMSHARSVLAAAESRAETWKGPCRKCRWCSVDPMGAVFDSCANPVIKLSAWDSSRGPGGDDYAVRCSRVRHGQICGADGKLFEAGNPVALLWLFVLVCVCAALMIPAIILALLL